MVRRMYKWLAAPVIIAGVVGVPVPASAASAAPAPTRIPATCSAYPGSVTGTTGTGYFEQCSIGSISAYVVVGGGVSEVTTGPTVTGPATATLRISSAKVEEALFISDTSAANGQPVAWQNLSIPLASSVSVPAGQSEQVAYGVQAPITKAQYQRYLKNGALPVHVVLVIK